jgi:ABC-type nitrate/sulfonate/bicarbonate transport system permease component
VSPAALDDLTLAGPSAPAPPDNPLPTVPAGRVDLAALQAREARRAGLVRLRRLGLRTLALAGLLAIWWGASAANTHLFQTVNPNLLPDPPAVLAEGARLWQRGSLQRDIVASLVRVLQGFLIAAASGVLAGTLVARSGWLGDLLEPVIDLLRPIPPLAFLPLLVLYLGIGNPSKIAFIAYAAFFPIFTTTREGMKYVDPLLIRAAQSLGAGPRQILWYVVVPGAVPNILTGLRLG